jgi:DNA-damage-inducible protein J
MAQSSMVQIRMSPELKREAERVFAGMGMDIPSAVRLFFTQTINRKKLPFEVSCSQESAIIKESEKEEEPVHIARSWDDPDSWLNNPITIGKDYRKITREEIYDESINRLGCMKGKK